jgi:threonine dehydratase
MSSALLVPGRSVEVKLENTQVTGTFKARGAFNSLLAGPVPKAGIVAASGGNHGAAAAYAARTLGHPARIFVPELAGPAKIALIRSTGADLVVVPGLYTDALAAARAYEAETGAMQIHAYDAPLTLEGQGTVMLEWEEQGLQADTVLIAVGGGGLIGGALAWLGGRRKVVAVEPVLAPTLHAALRNGPETVVEVGGIAANALGASRIGRLCYDLAVARGVEVTLGHRCRHRRGAAPDLGPVAPVCRTGGGGGVGGPDLGRLCPRRGRAGGGPHLRREPGPRPVWPLIAGELRRKAAPAREPRTADLIRRSLSHVQRRP